MLKIGLTGGIGCGKSTVTQLFSDLAIPIIDADNIAHQLVAIGQPALLQIELLFGSQVLNNDGSLNRAYLRDCIFSNTEQKTALEALLHPLIFQEIDSELAKLNQAYCIIAIPLLFETHQVNKVHRVLVVDCPIEMQLQRVQQRDNNSFEKIQAIINSQVSREFRHSHADDIIDNSLSIMDKGDNYNKLAEQVKKLHNLYLSLSNTRDVCL